MNTKIFKVYMNWLAYELRQEGFPIIRTEINPKKPQFDVYVFKDTELLREAITRITQHQ